MKKIKRNRMVAGIGMSVLLLSSAAGAAEKLTCPLTVRYEGFHNQRFKVKDEQGLSRWLSDNEVSIEKLGYHIASDKEKTRFVVEGFKYQIEPGTFSDKISVNVRFARRKFASEPRITLDEKVIRDTQSEERFFSGPTLNGQNQAAKVMVSAIEKLPKCSEVIDEINRIVSPEAVPTQAVVEKSQKALPAESASEKNPPNMEVGIMGGGAIFK